MSILFALAMFTYKFFFQLKGVYFLKKNILFQFLLKNILPYKIRGKYKLEILWIYVFQVNWNTKTRWCFSSVLILLLYISFTPAFLISRAYYKFIQFMTIPFSWLPIFLVSSLRTLLFFLSFAPPTLILISLFLTTTTVPFRPGKKQSFQL